MTARVPNKVWLQWYDYDARTKTVNRWSLKDDIEGGIEYRRAEPLPAKPEDVRDKIVEILVEIDFANCTRGEVADAILAKLPNRFGEMEPGHPLASCRRGSPARSTCRT